MTTLVLQAPRGRCQVKAGVVERLMVGASPVGEGLPSVQRDQGWNSEDLGGQDGPKGNLSQRG